MPQSNPPSLKSDWQPATRLAFRFAFTYFSLYMATFAPRIFRTPIARTYVEVWNPMVDWVGKHLLHLSSPIDVYVVGDTRFEYVVVLCIAMVAALITLVWTAAGSRHKDYSRLHEWFRLAIRLWLASYLISYGAGKVFPGQFLLPSLARYIGTYGDSNPMGLLWTLMGSSPGYQSFTGAVELSSGLLLLVPRVTTLGALLATAAVTNVLAMNMAFDVQVKIFAAHMLAAALVLITPDLRRLADFFTGRTAVLRTPPALFQRSGFNRAVVGAQLVFALYATSMMLIWGSHRVKERGELARNTPYYGIWMVDEFVLDGTPHLPLTTDEVRWQRIVIESPGSVVVQMMDGSVQRCGLKMEASVHSTEISCHDPDRSAKFTYAEEGGGTLLFKGTEDAHPVSLRLRHITPHFVLDTRGVRWVHPFPPFIR